AAQAFADEWQAMGGMLISRELISQPAKISGQIADVLRVRDSEQRNQRIQAALGAEVTVQPTPRADLDALFLAVDPLQARQIKPTLVFQYAGELPVYATSHAYRLSLNSEPNTDI